MVKVSIEVSSGAAHFDVGVQAESIRRAMSLVRERYPKGSVKVKFPIEPESFFVEDIAAQGGQIECEQPQEKTAA
jgi:predicted DNA-binding transcriptional regulator YafY